MIIHAERLLKVLNNYFKSLGNQEIYLVRQIRLAQCIC